MNVCISISYVELDFPEVIAKTLPPSAIDFIERLLELDPTKRLGANGVHEIRSHPFFEGINWETLLTEPMDDVFIPRPSDQQDTSYFWGRDLIPFILIVHIQ
jgi:serine/threonine-protein kinase RIM15